jgi:hypothetical protein
MVRMSVQSPLHSEAEAILMLLDFPFLLKWTGHLRLILDCLVRSRIAAELHNLGLS